MNRKILSLISLAMLACRNDIPQGSVSDGGAKDAALSPVDASTSGEFIQSTVAAMRQGPSGNYQLTDVVVIAVGPSTKSAKLWLQDPAGGDFSAMMAQCSSSSTSHKCTQSDAVAALPVGQKVTIKGNFIKSSKTLSESFYIADSATTDSPVVDKGAGTAPAAKTVTLADLQRSANKSALWFQKVSLTLPETLVMYDWSPTEMGNTSFTKCSTFPGQTGFAMIPQSAGAQPTMACQNSSSQPTGQANPDAKEILFGTTFYKGFTVSSDCRCAPEHSNKVPQLNSTLSGAVSGLLLFDVPFMGTTGYQFLSPLADADAPITNTK